MPTKREKERVRRWFKEWQKKLLLTHWSVELTFSDQSDPDNVDDITLLSCYPDINYHRLFVTVWQDFWGEPEETQVLTCVHELVHCATAPLGELASRAVKRKQAIRQDVTMAEEQLTHWITKIIFNLHNK